MPQVQLPFFPEGVTHITPLLAFSKQDGRITYFNGSMPVFSHDETDRDSFRMITAQFCESGNAKQADIARAFGVPAISNGRCDSTAGRDRKDSMPRGRPAGRRC